MRKTTQKGWFWSGLERLNDRLIEIRNPKKALINQHYRDAATRFSYRAASRNRIQLQKLGMGSDGDSHAKSGDLWTLREYSRALDRDNVIASAMLNRAGESIIGSGIDLQLLSGNSRWDDKAEKLFHTWWDTEADIRGMHVGWQIEKLALRSMQVDGDVLFILTDGGQIQPVEADRIVTPKEETLNKKVINGVKVDSFGRPEGFWISPDPSTSSAGSFSAKDGAFVSADHAVFLANMHRFSLTRGIPVFATNMQLFDDIDAFIEACIIHAKIAACHVLAIERNGSLNDLDGVEEVEDSYDNLRQEQTVSPGIVLNLKPGESAKMVGTTQTMVQFSPFITQLLRFTGLNFGMPLEMLSLDFSHTNYSSARAALLVAHRSFVAQHKMMTKRFMEPIVRWKIAEWIRNGELSNRTFKVSATPPRFISVDPLKEANADIARVQHGFSTNRDVCAALGTDWETLLQQRQAEIQAAVEAAQAIESSTGEKVDWRDILGDAKNFDADVYRDSDSESTETVKPKEAE